MGEEWRVGGREGERERREKEWGGREREPEREKEGERETEINFVACLLMHSLVNSRLCRYRGSNLQPRHIGMML